MSDHARADAGLVDRVRKLLDKAAGTDNPHEAEAFAAKAAELVATHRLDPDRLAAGRSTSSDPLGVRELVLGRGAYVRARFGLLDGIARAHDVRVVFQTTPTGMVAYLAGHRSDLDVVETMYSSLHQQAAAQMASIRRSTGAATQRYRRAFLFGFAERIAELLATSRRRVEEAASADRNGGTAMTVALRERSERVDDYAAREWPSVRAASRPRPVSPDGWRSGSAAAERADVGRPRLPGRRRLGPGVA